MSQTIQSLLSRLWRAIVAVSLVFIAVSAIIWSFDTAPPVKFISARLEQSSVDPGSFLQIDYEVETERLCPGDLQRVVADGRNVLHFIEPYTFTQTGKTANAIGKRNVRVSIPVPVGASPGAAKYQAILRYYCNPLQRFLNRAIEVETPLIEFTIRAGSNPVILREPADSKDELNPDDMRSVSLRPLTLASYAPVSHMRIDAPNVVNVCASGYAPVRAHERRIGNKVISIREHCRKRQSAPG